MKAKIYNGLFTFLFTLTAFFALSATDASAQPGRAKKLLEEGEKLMAQNNYQEALDRFARAVVIAPKFPAAYFMKARAHYSLNQYDEALEDFNMALAQGFRRPQEVYQLRWQIFFQKKDYDAARRDLQELIKLDPKNAVYAKNLGDIHLGKQEWNEALTAYRAVQQANPNDPDIYYFIALASSGQGNLDQQEINASDSIRKGTKYAGEAHFLLGDALQKRKRFEEAASEFQKAIEAKPDIYEAYANMADAYRSLNRFDDAIAAANKGLSVFKDDGNLYTSLSWFYSLAERHQEAISAGLQAIKFAPNQSMGYTNLCRAYNDTKQYQLALKACNDALKIHPNDGETNFYLGRTHDFLEKRTEANRFYQKAVTGLEEFTRGNPDYSDGFYLLGNAYYATDQRNKAIEAYKRSLELSPRFSKARYNLAYMYFLENNMTAARDQYEQLKRSDPVLAERLKQAMDKK